MDQNTDSLKQISVTRPKETKPKLEGYNDEEEVPKLLDKLEQTNWNGLVLYNYKGLWCPSMQLGPILCSRKYFSANDSDIILATNPKSGTTWLKALTFSIAYRDKFPISQTPLLTHNPHELVPAFEFDIYSKHGNSDISNIPCPRIFSTHISYPLLPSSVHEGGCKIIYICRNPLDQFVSLWHFLLQNKFALRLDSMYMEEIFKMFCKGIHPNGPFWDHMLGYWNASLENPQKVLFLKYEDLKEDIISSIKKIAEFTGYPFSTYEETKGSIEEIVSVCSFENLKSVAESSLDSTVNSFQKTSFYRKGEVGDWVNHLTPAMVERLRNLIEEKLGDSGLSFK